MLEIFPLLMQGFQIAFQPENLLLALAGAFLGTIVGVLPGIGPAGALSLTLPLVLNLEPVSGMILLAALYSGAMYGGSTTSILLNVPGESASVVTCLDGHAMARQGRAGAALGISAIGSYIAGTLGVIGLMLFGPWLAESALRFGPPEYFALMVFGLTAVVSLSGASLVKGLLATCVGLALSTIGVDVTGVSRFTFGISEIMEGVAFIALAIGLFAISEVMLSAGEIKREVTRKVLDHRGYVTLSEIRESMGAILRGSFIGFLIGVLPGAGAGVSSFLAYSFETQISKHPERFGKGEIRGVAAPESANNAASAGALVPMLTLGIPGSGTTAVMLLALASVNVKAGPLLFAEHPDIVWGLIAALYVGNVMLLVLNLPLVGIFVRLLYTPACLLYPIIMVLGVVGVYSANQSVFDSLTLVALGLLGFFMRSNKYPVAPIILGFVLGDGLEESLRQSMIMTRGNFLAVLESPIALVCFMLAAFVLFAPLIIGRLRFRGQRVELEQESS
jgi:putative tricarboxylic transport membrane protein